MDILGIGPLELLFILIIALIVLGPNDMVKAGRTAGRFLRRIVTSPTWRMVQQTSRDLRNLPNTLIRDAGLEDDVKKIQDGLKVDQVQAEIQEELNQLDKVQKKAHADLSDWTTPPKTSEISKTEPKITPFEDQAIVAEPALSETADVSNDESEPDLAIEEPVSAEVELTDEKSEENKE